jgi:anti-anti-sigma factor
MSLAPGEHSQPGLTQVMLSTRLISELGDPRSTLRATIQRNGPVVIIRAGGEIDASNEDTWRRLVSEAATIAAPPGPLVVDVSGCDFMGCCAISALADEAERCRSRGVGLRLVSCNRSVTRIIEACELSVVLPVHPTTESALSPAVA